ncbi:DNA/RNA nuclease SfsA [bacterium]|nr:DNA/RNA nuclease SfsA [bacterium]MCP5462114.1 DNA/RNA nuclease SfsA [bacterium]
MKFHSPLLSGVILRRYKRFLCDIVLDNNNEHVVAHCPNSGSMKGIPLFNSHVMVSYNPLPSRKYQYTLEMVHNGNTWIGINTMYPNSLVEEGIINGTIAELNPYSSIKREVVCSDKSRLDLMVEQRDSICYVEVKNVTLAEGSRALFPDSVTLRGQKHLLELIRLKRSGYRAIMIYVVQRSDCIDMGPAWNIDSEYAEKLVAAVKEGVEAYVYQAEVSPEEITLIRRIPIEIHRTII